MSNLDRLPIANMGDAAQPGYSKRVRQPLEGVSLDELDAEVAAAGGRVAWASLPATRGLRPGRRVAPAGHPHRASWYEIPDSAFSQE
jgi:hypothetical protein